METFKVSYELYTKHTRGKDGSPCTAASAIKVFIGEAGPHDIPCGFLASVSLSMKSHLPDTFTFSPSNVNLTEQPFEHTIRANASFPSDSCPFCKKGNAGEGATLMDVEVKVDFEPMPVVTAGSAIQPSQTPPSWHGTHSLDLSNKAKTSFEHSRVLMEVDYDKLYRPPLLTPIGDTEGTADGRSSTTT